jgi:hypothetical protein
MFFQRMTETIRRFRSAGNDRDRKIGIPTYCGFHAIGGDAHIRSSIAETVDLLNSSCIFVEQDLVGWSRT